MSVKGEKPPVTGYDVVVVGGGSAGCAAALRAAQLGRRVALVESRQAGIGGAYVHETVVPLGVFRQAAEARQLLETPGESALELDGGVLRLNWGRLVHRKLGVQDEICRYLRDQLQRHGVTLVEARGYLAGEHEVVALDPQSADELARLEARSVVLATGSRVLAFAQTRLDGKCICSPEQLFALDHLPTSCLVYGCGALACEIASVLMSLGTRVTLLLNGPALLCEEDEEVSEFVTSTLIRRGCGMLMEPQVSGIETVEGGCRVVVESAQATSAIEAEVAVMATRGRPNSDHLGIRKLGIETNKLTGGVVCDSRFRTRLEHIYAVGECVDAEMPSSLARTQGTFVAEEIAGTWPGDTSMELVMRRVATVPPVAGVGITAAQAAARGIKMVVGRSALCSALSLWESSESPGFVKLYGDAQTGELLGASAVGKLAEEAVSLVGQAMRFEYTLGELACANEAQGLVHEVLARAAREALAQCAAAKTRVGE